MHIKVKAQKSILPLVTISFIWFVFNLSNYLWVKKSSAELIGDSAIHFFFSLLAYEGLKNPLLIISNPAAFIGYSFPYPPFFYYLISPFFALFGKYESTAIIANGAVSSSILFFAVYKIAAFLHSRKTGIFAVFIVSFYPYVYTIYKDLYLEVFLTSLVTLSIFSLLKTASFRKTNYAAYFAILCALSFLTKFTAPVFIAAAALLVSLNICASWKEYSANMRNSVVRNLALTMILVITIIAPWAVINKNKILPAISSLTEMGKILGYNNFTPASNIYYFAALSDAITLPMLLIFAASLFLLPKNLRNLMILWALMPLAVFFFIFVKEIRYLLPMFPALAITTSIGINEIKSCFVKRLSYIFIIAFLSASFIVNTAVTPERWRKYIKTYKWKTNLKLRNDYDPIFIEFPRHFYYPAANYNRGTDELLDLIKLYNPGGANIYVGTGCTDIYPALLYKSKLMGLSNIFYLDRTGYAGSGLMPGLDFIFLREGSYEEYDSNEKLRKMISGFKEIRKTEFIINPEKENGIIKISIYKAPDKPATLSPASSK